MGIKRNLVFDKMLTAFYSFQSFKVLFAKSLTIFHIYWSFKNIDYKF